MLRWIANWSFWSKVVAAALAAGGAGAGVAGTTAVVRTYTLDTRVVAVERRVSDLGERQRTDHDQVIELRTDVRYLRSAIDKLLDSRGISRPQE